MKPTSSDIECISKQLGRTPRGLLAIAFRCSDNQPAVITTHPFLPGGTPFPTLYYLTHPRLVAAISTLESSHIMDEMNSHLAQNPALQEQYRRAHENYLIERNALADLKTDFTTGGMPGRVKCLHALGAHSLAKGPGVNPFGDHVLASLQEDPIMAELIGAIPFAYAF